MLYNIGGIEMYRNRIIEAAIKNVADSFPCIVIYGSRQVGKSTTVNYIFGKKYVELRCMMVIEGWQQSQIQDYFLKLTDGRL